MVSHISRQEVEDLVKVKTHPLYTQLMHNEEHIGTYSTRDRPSIHILKWLAGGLISCRWERPTVYHTAILTNKRIITVQHDKTSETIFETHEQDSFIKHLTGIQTKLKTRIYPIYYALNHRLEPVIRMGMTFALLLSFLSVFLTLSWPGIPLITEPLIMIIVSALMASSVAFIIILKKNKDKGDFSVHLEKARIVMFFLIGAVFLVLSAAFWFAALGITIAYHEDDSHGFMSNLYWAAFVANVLKQIVGFVLMLYIFSMYPSYGSSDLITMQLRYEGERDFTNSKKAELHQTLMLSMRVSQDVRQTILRLKNDISDMRAEQDLATMEPGVNPHHPHQAHFEMMVPQQQQQQYYQEQHQMTTTNNDNFVSVYPSADIKEEQ